MIALMRAPVLTSLFVIALLGVGVGFATQASAQEEVATTEVVAVEAAAEDAPAYNAADSTYTINTLIMFICAVLVFFMQAGFAMVEVGLNSAKNTINILAKNVMDLAIGVILYLFIGFALMYPTGASGGGWFVDGYLGTPTSGFISRDDTSAPGAYSESANFLFQVAFAATAATIVSGAVAGRMKFGAYLIYSAVITGLIYPISGSWKWGYGFLHEMGFQDFAGSILVHAVGGFAGLAGAIVLGPRLGRFTADGKSVPLPGHNITFAALGVFILWIGWYGFNPGSLLAYSGASNAEAMTYIAVTTTLAASAGAVIALLCAWALFSKPDLTMALNGVLGGLVAITAGCDRVEQWEALLIGGIGGALVVAGVILLDKLKIDDPVGAWPVHGLCGVWGGLATGIFGNLPDGIESVGAFIGVQAFGTALIAGFSLFTMLTLFLLLKALGALRVTPEEEMAGLDISEHGMHAYPADAMAGAALSRG
jgi:ammonium transporter, Amt family